MPTEGGILGFRNRWYPAAIAHALGLSIDGQRIRVVDAPHFCATKLDALVDRGHGDFYHHDLEDVIAVVDGRHELLEDLTATPAPVRNFVSSGLRVLLNSPAFLEALPGHLPGDTASQARVPLVRARLEALANLDG